LQKGSRKSRSKETWRRSSPEEMAFAAVNREPVRTHFFRATIQDKDERLDQFLAVRVKDLTRSRAQALVRGGFVQANGRTTKPSYRLKTGDFVTLTLPSPRPYHLIPEPVVFSVIHEDSSLIVVNKPPGVVVHPAPGHHTGTLVHGLLQHCRDLSGIGGELRPGIVHRLDKDTSGLMVVAKNDKAHASLAAQFKAKQVTKEYIALVHGIIKGNEGTIDLPIGRHPVRRKEMAVLRSGGREAVTRWRKVEEISESFSLLAVAPRTGRTHQIRVHLSHAGHPVVGDPVYGFRRTWWKKHFPHAQSEVKRQMLHAGRLGFIDPDSGLYCEFSAPLPEDMEHVANLLRENRSESE
jgi:23S rRNA pseudouridine1911/1915/1917 synthase